MPCGRQGSLHSGELAESPDLGFIGKTLLRRHLLRSVRRSVGVGHQVGNELALDFHLDFREPPPFPGRLPDKGGDVPQKILLTVGILTHQRGAVPQASASLDYGLEQGRTHRRGNWRGQGPSCSGHPVNPVKGFGLFQQEVHRPALIRSADRSVAFTLIPLESFIEVDSPDVVKGSGHISLILGHKFILHPETKTVVRIFPANPAVNVGGNVFQIFNPVQSTFDGIVSKVLLKGTWVYFRDDLLLSVAIDRIA